MICNSSSRHSEGMTNRDCSTVYVDFVRLNAQQSAVSYDDHSESFIDLPEVDILHTEAVVGQESSHPHGRGHRPVSRLECGVSVANYPGQGLQAQPRQPSLVGQQGSRGPVSQLGDECSVNFCQ